MAKRWGRAKGREVEGATDDEGAEEEMYGTVFPIACSGRSCEKRSHLMLPGDSPYVGGLFEDEGWTAVVAERPPALTFLCGACFQKEVANNQVETRRRTPVGSLVSG